MPAQFDVVVAGLLSALGLSSLRHTSVVVLVSLLDDAPSVQALLGRMFALGATRVRVYDMAVAVLAASAPPPRPAAVGGLCGRRSRSQPAATASCSLLICVNVSVNC